MQVLLFYATETNSISAKVLSHIIYPWFQKSKEQYIGSYFGTQDLADNPAMTHYGLTESYIITYRENVSGHFLSIRPIMRKFVTTKNITVNP